MKIRFILKYQQKFDKISHFCDKKKIEFMKEIDANSSILLYGNKVSRGNLIRFAMHLSWNLDMIAEKKTTHSFKLNNKERYL